MTIDLRETSLTVPVDVKLKNGLHVQVVLEDERDIEEPKIDGTARSLGTVKSDYGCSFGRGQAYKLWQKLFQLGAKLPGTARDPSGGASATNKGTPHTQ